jgi:hypothetical protein
VYTFRGDRKGSLLLSIVFGGIVELGNMILITGREGRRGLGEI